MDVSRLFPFRHFVLSLSPPHTSTRSSQVGLPSIPTAINSRGRYNQYHRRIVSVLLGRRTPCVNTRPVAPAGCNLSYPYTKFGAGQAVRVGPTRCTLSPSRDRAQACRRSCPGGLFAVAISAFIQDHLVHSSVAGHPGRCKRRFHGASTYLHSSPPRTRRRQDADDLF